MSQSKVQDKFKMHSFVLMCNVLLRLFRPVLELGGKTLSSRIRFIAIMKKRSSRSIPPTSSRKSCGRIELLNGARRRVIHLVDSGLGRRFGVRNTLLLHGHLYLQAFPRTNHCKDLWLYVVPRNVELRRLNFLWRRRAPRQRQTIITHNEFSTVVSRKCFTS